LTNRTAPEIEHAVVAMANEQPAWGQVRVSEALKRQGLSISTAGVRCVWQRHELTSMKHRLKALEANVARLWCCLAQTFRASSRRCAREGQGSLQASTRRGFVRCGDLVG
jgi:hypothetical protein